MIALASTWRVLSRYLPPPCARGPTSSRRPARIGRCPQQVPINGRVSHWYRRSTWPTVRRCRATATPTCASSGAGYTGLWTAYYLKRADPSLRIVVLEARFAGFGASGRNGGWLSGLVPGDRNRMAQQHGRDRVVAWQRALNEAVDEVIDVAAREGIDAGIVKGGTMQIARNPAQASRLAAEIDEELSWKVDGIAPLTKAEAAERIRFDGVVSAYHTPHCARDPARPAGARSGRLPSERLGVDIYEQSPVTAIEPGRRDARHSEPSPRRSCCARPRASPRALPGLRRRWLPMNSSMIATDPISDDRLGSRSAGSGRETARRHRARLLLRPAHRRRPDRDRRPQRAVPLWLSHRRRRAGARAHDRAPDRDAALDPAAGPGCPDRARLVWRAGRAARLVRPASCSTRPPDLGWAGGYVGHGVTATNLAGRTLADLVLDQRRPLTELPWVGHRSPNWEPEPLRWIGSSRACIRRTSWRTGTRAAPGYRTPHRSQLSPTKSQAGP